MSDATDAPRPEAAATVPTGAAEPTGPVSSGEVVAEAAAPRLGAAGGEEPGESAPRRRRATKKATPVAGADASLVKAPAAKKATPPKKATARKTAGPPPAPPVTEPDVAPPAGLPGDPAQTNAETATARTDTTMSDAAKPPTVEPTAATRTKDAAVVTPAAGTRATAEASPSGRTRELGLAELRTRLLDHPGFAPELLALAAVEAVGPRARDWAHGLREAYPDAGPDGLARLATRRYVRAAGAGGAAAAVAGLFAPAAELVAVLWTQAGLVLHLAAAYGRDPLHPDRAVELLVLTQVHPDGESARTALDAARAADGPGDRPWPRAVEAAWRLAAPLAVQAGGWAALRLASRLLPGAAVLATAAGDAAAAERLAARAVAVYRPVRAS
ncbi:hypothetical protein V6U81_11115 [Micromonospora sp. CPCC 205711]|uniref:hypothetical protein n=1 Tax=Micromonospora sp. CPCC 205547 TaxID=3122400 RepID=UPI002FF298A4